MTAPARAGEPLRGNRSWRIETPRGPALQKLYVERGRAYSVALRDALVLLARTKSPSRALARRATERRLLSLWREHGVDVPADWTDDLPQFGAPDVAVHEFIAGSRPLWDLVVEGEIEPAAREALLRRFADSWGRRHAEALRAREAGLVQEHATIRHVLVAGGRLVWIDHEQAFLPRSDVRPLVAKEVTDLLRSLWKRVGSVRFAADLAVIVDAYPDRTVLRGAVDSYLAATGARRILWAIDRRLRTPRRRRAKYGMLEALDEELRRRGS